MPQNHTSQQLKFLHQKLDKTQNPFLSVALTTQTMLSYFKIKTGTKRKNSRKFLLFYIF